MTTQLTLIRHGQSMWNASGRAQGHAIIPLTALGHQQARQVADFVARRDAITALYCSDLTRCRQTMDPIAAVLKMPVRYDPRLREIDVGAWQGMEFAQIRELDADRWTAFKADPFNVSMPGGESQQMLRERVVASVQDMAREHPDSHILVVMHGGPICELLRYYGLLNAHPWSAEEPKVANTSRTVLRIENGGLSAELVLMADVAHLPAE